MNGVVLGYVEDVVVGPEFELRAPDSVHGREVLVQQPSGVRVQYGYLAGGVHREQPKTVRTALEAVDEPGVAASSFSLRRDTELLEWPACGPRVPQPDAGGVRMRAGRIKVVLVAHRPLEGRHPAEAVAESVAARTGSQITHSNLICPR